MIEKPRLTDVLDLVFAAALVAWFLLPLTGGPIPASPATGEAVAGGSVPFRTWNMAATFAAATSAQSPVTALLAAWIMPVFALWRLVAFFTPIRNRPPVAADGSVTGISRIVVSLTAAVISAVPMLTFADSSDWFAAQTQIVWLSGVIAVIANVAAVYLFLMSINQRNPVFLEYQAFRKIRRGQRPEGPNSKGIAFLDVFFRIRSKLLLAFISIISVIVLVLSLTLLGNYRSTILKAVGDGARTQVAQAAAAYRVNLGDSIAMTEYVNRQVELNAGAEFTYHDLTIFTNLKGEVFLDDEKPAFPDYRAEYSTLDPTAQFPAAAPFPADRAEAWFAAMRMSGRVTSLDDPKAGTVTFTSPIIKIDTVRKGEERIRRERLLGFSVLTFDREVIMRPYFRTRVSVILFTSFFIYLSVVLTYVIGNYIVNPLLFLRMNVRKISEILSTMIRGESRIAPSALVYTDCVTSRDEIKSLSYEINEMVSVIRGIVPYISASTLKNAETGAASTTRKELAFLFTDIRGFTTLCEGMQPEEVVTILNQYLDLETEIILNNHGDVDKFVGDEMMAFFEGPLKEVNACRAAMEIRHAMMEEKERREKEGLPIVAIGIGINTGPVVFGSVGARDRKDFTSIGDTVNLAARLEGANKEYGSKSLITEAVYDKVKDEYLCREIDLIAVKGKNEPVRIFEILQERPKAQPKLVEIKNQFEKGLEAYRRRKWDVAAKVFEKNADLFKDAPSKVYLERALVYAKAPPPEDWDGVFRMTVK